MSERTAAPASAPRAPVAIRALRGDDAEALHALLSRPAVAAWRCEAPHRSLAWRRDWLDTLLAQRHGFGAWVDGALAGFGELAPLRLRRHHAAQLELAVHDGQRRRGVGTALLREMLRFADGWLGLRRLELDLHADDAAALALYAGFGFETEGFRRGGLLRGGELVDLRMLARLREPMPVAAPAADPPPVAPLANQANASRGGAAGSADPSDPSDPPREGRA
ncbi:GNAT family N-acetyltransferase [Burkholderia glumae]|uniref:GNAT family N-acetyltransferase n=1 Tax=Burkholderia glumae TaxID=337 RepID=UPI0013745925|nr:GNAT family N-acetyltransferase [Burkholderia glumae]MCR1769636.1 GNAT family N-acetyltransferase [Burkholderia glumae]QHP93419.1 GNAT family N-acetyltransferase [Burkholderia glumae]QJP69681.1 GNAT family N-acetyltransferase [Burkholderia glumae]QKM51079.1 N-alpha-acetyltransferase RimI [Burkholderia glumae]